MLEWIRVGQRRPELQGLLRRTNATLSTLTAVNARGLAELLWDLGMVEAAYAVSAQPSLSADPELAAQRARFAMHLRDYPAAIAASDVAIAALLQPGLAIEEFLRLSSAGAPAEGMLRFERHVLGSRAHLSERLALRWEALHRAGMRRDASLMQLMCQRYFPERVSVWATAGNHALDTDDLEGAEGYFQRCLQLDANWTAALAGLAIVCERRKQWAAALPYRRRVVVVKKALERDDAANLQRRLRYAAALARLDHWREAEPLFRAAVSCSALSQLPAERAVLLRVFSQELYAPALVAALDSGTKQADTEDPAITLAQHEAALLEQLASTLRGQPNSGDRAKREGAGLMPTEAASALAMKKADSAAGSSARREQPHPVSADTVEREDASVVLPEAERARALEPAGGVGVEPAASGAHVGSSAAGDAELRWSLALCAFLSGDLERAFEWLDQVEVQRPDDLALHYLLWRCASAIDHPQTASIRSFAEQAARSAWATPDALSQQARGYALALVPSLHRDPAALPMTALEELQPLEGPAVAQLERIVAFRALNEAAGASPLSAAALSTLALAALTAAAAPSQA